MTLEDALRKSRKDGIQYGIGIASDKLTDEAAGRWADTLAGRPAFSALYATDQSWTRTISRTTAQRFDYVLLDSRTLLDSKKLDMDSLVDQTVKRLSAEPIDIYAFPTYPPASLRADADPLWTDSRTAALIDALLKNQVAVEINTRERLPNPAFVKQAKQAGCKFAFGTGNETAQELKRCEYGLEMVESCQLDWHNFFAPGSWGPKAVDRRWV